MHARIEEAIAIARSLPPHTITLKMRNPRGVFERSFTGASLWDYAVAARIVPADVHQGGMGNHYFVAMADDGFRVALGFGEVSPHFASKDVLVAYEQDGERLGAGLRLVVPGDDLAGRSILGFADIELRQVESTAEMPGPRSTFLDVGGLVERPHRYYPATIPRLTRRYVQMPPAPRQGDEVEPGARFAGVFLYELLEAAGITLDPAINEDVLRKVIVARSVDGYAAVIAAGEIEPRFMNGGALVALSRDTEALRDDEGLFRLVVPYDRAVGRSVKRLASIELRDA